jgi:hypothetical protein
MSQTENKYVVLAETNGKDLECWYYFIKYNGNEKALAHLQEQLEKVEFFIMNDLSIFDLDLDHLMAEQTAKEMVRLEVNVYFHRMFNGKLKMIDFGFKEKESNDKKILKVFKTLGIGQIDKFIDDEYVDPTVMALSNEDSGSESNDESSDDYEYNYEDYDDTE